MMSYTYSGNRPLTDEVEAHTLKKFAYFRKAEAEIDAGPEAYEPAPFRKRQLAAQCGTHSGYKTHITNHTTPCQECREARALYQREYRASRKAAA